MRAGAAVRIGEGLRAYRLIAAMWVRSTLAYRTSFLLTALGHFAATGLDFLAILLMFSHITVLGGFTLPEVAFLYGTSNAALGLADLALGSMDRLGSRVRDGTMDVLLVRPVPVFAQVAADRFALRRLGRITQAALVLGWSLTRVEVDWTPGRVLLVPLMLLSGTVIFGAVFTLGAAFQFVAQDAAEVQNSFTYGGPNTSNYQFYGTAPPAPGTAASPARTLGRGLLVAGQPQNDDRTAVTICPAWSSVRLGTAPPSNRARALRCTVAASLPPLMSAHTSRARLTARSSLATRPGSMVRSARVSAACCPASGEGMPLPVAGSDGCAAGLAGAAADGFGAAVAVSFCSSSNSERNPPNASTPTPMKIQFFRFTADPP